MSGEGEKWCPGSSRFAGLVPSEGLKEFPFRGFMFLMKLEGSEVIDGNEDGQFVCEGWWVEVTRLRRKEKTDRYNQGNTMEWESSAENPFEDRDTAWVLTLISLGAQHSPTVWLLQGKSRESRPS